MGLKSGGSLDYAAQTLMCDSAGRLSSVVYLLAKYRVQSYNSELVMELASRE